MAKFRVTFKRSKVVETAYSFEVEAESVYEASCIAEESELPEDDSPLWLPVANFLDEEEYEVEEV